MASIPDRLSRLSRSLRRAVAARTVHSLSCAVPIRDATTAAVTAVDEYWTGHTVNSVPFETAEASLEYLDWRFRDHPLFRELMRLYEIDDNAVVLDYGCGPGNDLVGYLVHSNARRIIGVDVSETALRLASHRLGLHRGFDLGRVELHRKSDRDPAVPLPDASVDHVYTEGVLHHTSDPEAILGELCRVLRPGGTAAVMVYLSPSLWKHLYVAYDVRVVQGRFRDLSLDDAFARCTDGVDCPVSRNYEPEQFSAMCLSAGFSSVTFAGGFLSSTELERLDQRLDQAIADPRLDPDSREFLRSLHRDNRGYPRHRGKYAGGHGVFWLAR